MPGHLVPDARTQVYRYCLNPNFRDEYQVYNDIFALLHDDVRLGAGAVSGRLREPKAPQRMEQILVTFLNQFKKALTVDGICAKVRPHRVQILVVAGEVGDFLDRDKLVLNICSNKGSAFDRPTLELYFEVGRASCRSLGCLGVAVLTPGPVPGGSCS